MKQPLSIEFNKRELQITKLLCRQYSNREIAEKTGLTLRTVEDYRAKLLKKTRSRNAVGIVLFAIRTGLFTP